MHVLLWTLVSAAVGIGTWAAIDRSANRVALEVTEVLEHVDPP